MAPARKYQNNLCDLYNSYNKREFVHPDPLEFLYNYNDPEDREIVGLIASCLAYGSVWQILKTIKNILEQIDSPKRFLINVSHETLLKIFKDFKYRFTTGEELATMLFGIKRVVEDYGSLQKCFLKGYDSKHENILSGATFLVMELSSVFNGCPRSLLPSPARGSACKRLNLFLRWMVRNDNVDPGGWSKVTPSKLIVPMDVHMGRICRSLKLTHRKQSDMKAALEVTEAFRKIEPDDPVRYDFCLTRLGIRDDLTPDSFLRGCGV
ncbi:MAG: TIGR02757 family protein [Desulfomonilaceae bacterium]